MPALRRTMTHARDREIGAVQVDMIDDDQIAAGLGVGDQLQLGGMRKRRLGDQAAAGGHQEFALGVGEILSERGVFFADGMAAQNIEHQAVRVHKLGGCLMTQNRVVEGRLAGAIRASEDVKDGCCAQL